MAALWLIVLCGLLSIIYAVWAVRTVLAADAGRWSDIAATAGYYDQSHMTAEFRHFMGVPPAAFTAGRRPAATPCTA